MQDTQTDQIVAALIAPLPTSEEYVADVPFTQYGLSPLEFARTPDSPWRRLQQSDGGWPIEWQAPGESARWESRVRWTLDALTMLHACGET